MVAIVWWRSRSACRRHTWTSYAGWPPQAQTHGAQSVPLGGPWSCPTRQCPVSCPLQPQKGEGVVAPRSISQDAHSLGEVVRKKGEDGTKDLVVPPVVPPQLQGHRAVVQDVEECLDLTTQGV